MQKSYSKHIKNDKSIYEYKIKRKQVELMY